jgi:hypothetical protein
VPVWQAFTSEQTTIARSPIDGQLDQSGHLATIPLVQQAELLTGGAQCGR